MGCIYRIVCINSGKCYIGQTKADAPNKRYTRHWNDAIKRNVDTPLYRAMRKYGINNFILETLFIGSEKSLDNMECYFAEQYESYIWQRGFNAIICGRSVQRNFNHKKEHRERMSNLMTGRTLSSETREKISKSKVGTKCRWNDETRQRVSELSRNKAIGNKHSEATKIKIGLSKKGKPSPMKGIPKSEETKQKLRISRSGILHTEETKQRMREKHRELLLKNPNANKSMRYTEDEIRYIRTNPDNLSRKQLADKFKMCFQNVSNIVLRKTYKHIL